MIEMLKNRNIWIHSRDNVKAEKDTEENFDINEILKIIGAYKEGTELLKDKSNSN